MIELGVGMDDSGGLKVGAISVGDSSLANAAGVDRRVVRNAVKQILNDSDLKAIFTNVKPIGTSLVDVAKQFGYSVLVVNADPHRPGVISGISTILSKYDVVIRQALADDPDFTPNPVLTLVIDGQVPSEALSMIRSLKLVKSLTLK